MKLDIRHDPARGRFFASIDGAEAYLLYTEAGAGTLNFTRTYVPDALRHQKIGEAIVKHALDHAAANGFEVIPTCPFVKWVCEWRCPPTDPHRSTVTNSANYRV